MALIFVIAINFGMTKNAKTVITSLALDNIEAMASSELVVILDCGQKTGQCWTAHATETVWCNPYTKVLRQVHTGAMNDSYTDCADWY